MEEKCTIILRGEEFDPEHLKGDKGNRDGGCWIGNCDELVIPEGEVTWRDLDWRAGRLAEIRCEGGARLLGMRFRRAGYPYRWRDTFRTSETALGRLMPMARRTLEMCSHDIYMDCPYYERMMYVGDAKIEMLAGYVGTPDTRLAEKALGMFARTAGADGMIRSRCPSKFGQTIPGFAAIYVTMIHDFACWRDKPETVREVLPAARGILECFRRHTGADGLARVPGWHFVDWAAGWREGVPPGCESDGTCSAENAFYALALAKMAELEEGFGDHGAAARCRNELARLRQAVFEKYFDSERGLLADDSEHRSFSEHPQLVMALAGDEPALIDALRRHGGLNPAGIYFSHYYFEACRRYRLEDELHRRLARWYRLEDEGLSTVPEEFDNPRSDCHAWSAHPFFHYYATLLGIRPVGFGARRFEVSPMPGAIRELAGSIPTPHGEIRVALNAGNLEVAGIHPAVSSAAPVAVK